MKYSGKSSKRKASGPKPYNPYNLYFILERERFLQERGVYPSEDAIGDNPKQSRGIDINIPPFPSKYSSLILPSDWFVNKGEKRAQLKTHGSVSFREMAPMIASRFKREDPEIVLFVKTIANNIKKRINERKEPQQNPILFPSMVPQQNPILIPSMVKQEAPSLRGRPKADQKLQIEIATLEDRIRMINQYLQHLPTTCGQHGHSCYTQEDHLTRCSSSNSQADVVSNEEIMRMWSSAP